MDRELNYAVEAASQLRFQQHVTTKGLKVPDIYLEYTRSRLLIQS